MKNQSLALAVAIIAGISPTRSIGQNIPAATDAELEEIVVIGSQIRLPESFAGGQVAEGGRAGILGNLQTLETPFSSTSYTSELMLNQQARSVADVLLNDPNVRAARGFGNFQEVFMIRGFPAYSDDMTYNGIYGILPRQFVASELMERVELFRGASAFLNGAAPGGSNLGGTINLVPKRAPAGGLTRLAAGYENSAAAYVAADVGRRFGAEDATGIRANAVYRGGETAVDNQDRELTMVSFGIDHQGDKLRLTADLGYQDHHIDSPRASVTPDGGVAKTPDAEANFAQPWTYSEEKQLFGVARAEYDLTPSVALWAAAGLRDGDESNDLANPTAVAVGSTEAFRFYNAREDAVSSAEVGLRWDFVTGPIAHRAIVSGSLYALESKNAFSFYFEEIVSDLYQPVALARPSGAAFLGGDVNNPRKTFTTDTSSYAIADMLTMLDDTVIVTLGARQQNLKNESFAYGTAVKESSYDESKVTPVGGIVYRPTDTISLFANYVEGLVAGDIAPTQGPSGQPVVNGGQVQEPYVADQLEVGVKFESDKIGASLSAFEINKGFGILTGAPDDPATTGQDLVYRNEGEQRNRGIEVGVYGAPLQELRIIGGITLLDAEFASTQGGVSEGNTPIGAPKTQANVNVEWDLPVVTGLTLEARAMYTSSQYADAANTLEIDSWTRFDLGARYATEVAGRPLSVRARIDNAMNEGDWVSAGGFPGFGYLVLGAPRTFVLSASVDF